MADEWLLDTDILVDYLRGIPQAIDFITSLAFPCYISIITMAELYAGVREGIERQILDEFLNEFKIIQITEKIAKQGGIFRRDYGKSHSVGLADAIIAATADDLGIKLATLNKKHYPMINANIPYTRQVLDSGVCIKKR